MTNLSDDLLHDVYQRAKELCLSADFIQLIKEELTRRGLVFGTD